MKLYKREHYLKKIRGFYQDTGIIKVITGVRRCGKSCLMNLIVEELLEQGVSESNICFIDLNRHGYKSIRTSEALEMVIEKESVSSGIKYLFIDEIQNIKNFESVIEAYRIEGDYSIFITGSNSYLLSGEMATKLTGRYLEFEMYTLTFEEYIGMKRFYNKEISTNLTLELDNYIIEGGFPKTVEYDEFADKRKYVMGIIQEIFEKDIKRRVKIRNTDTFYRIQRYIINNFGSTTSISNIEKDISKQGINIKRETIKRYIQILEDAKIVHKCSRFDLKSRKSINGEEKYYLSDLSFYFVNNVDNRINYGPVLENIVYQYARSNDYLVSIGKIGNLECDFILRDPQLNYSYVQVALTIMNGIETEDREYRSLERIRDGYPKYLLTRGDLIQHRNGIKHKNIPEFMVNNEKFE